jgi:hypothetical protein
LQGEENRCAPARAVLLFHGSQLHQECSGISLKEIVGEVRLIYEMGRFKAPRLHVKEGDVPFCISVFLSTLSPSTPPLFRYVQDAARKFYNKFLPFYTTFTIQLL